MGITEVAGLAPRPGTTLGEIEKAEQALGRHLPEDYRRFLSETNGLEGFVAPNMYLVLWSASELETLNTAYGVREFAPTLVLLGTNGGDTAYGFKAEAGGTFYIRVPLVGLSDGSAEPFGASLIDMIMRIKMGR